MSFECGNCGKRPVRQYGQWCPTCQVEEELAYLDNQGVAMKKLKKRKPMEVCQNCKYGNNKKGKWKGHSYCLMKRGTGEEG